MGYLDRGGVQPRRTDAERLAALLDRAEIHDALMTYLRAVDRCDKDQLAAVYQEDALDERGPHVHVGGKKIAASIVDRVSSTSKASTHTMCNELIEVDGDSARSECYFMAYLVLPQPNGDHLRQFAGRYLDQWERRNDGRWRIAHRVVVADWGEIRPLQEQDPAWVDFKRGARSPADASYSLTL
jgi:ketosteroid isomerase-like protein